MNDLAKLIYTLFIGGTIAVTVALTLSVANPGPAFPDMTSYPSGEPSQQEMKDQENAYKNYDKERAQHTSDTAKILTVASLAIFALGLAAFKLGKLQEVISEGVLFSGFFIAVYSILQNIPSFYIPGAEQPDRWISVIAAFVALAMIIIITQRKFTATSTKKKTSRKK